MMTAEIPQDQRDQLCNKTEKRVSLRLHEEAELFDAELVKWAGGT